MRSKKIGTGELFQDTAKSFFVRMSARAYDNMEARVVTKGFPGLPFSKDDFRARLLLIMDGNYDGIFRCRYCNGFFALNQIAVDHAHPLSRGGGVELDNLEFPCRACNFRKGSLTPEEYLDLLDFLDNKIPLGKNDVLQRLQISVQLAAANRALRKKHVTS